MEGVRLSFFESIEKALKSIESNRSLQRIAREFQRLGKVAVIGNGGSDAIAQHMVTDLINLGYQAVTTPHGVLTAAANDNGWIDSHTRWLDRILFREDLLVIISSSGESNNMTSAAFWAKRHRIHVITLTGFNPENTLRGMGDDSIWVPSDNYGVVECIHQTILHGIINMLEDEMEG